MTLTTNIWCYAGPRGVMHRGQCYTIVLLLQSLSSWPLSTIRYVVDNTLVWCLVLEYLRINSSLFSKKLIKVLLHFDVKTPHNALQVTIPSRGSSFIAWPIKTAVDAPEYSSIIIVRKSVLGKPGYYVFWCIKCVMCHNEYTRIKVFPMNQCDQDGVQSYNELVLCTDWSSPGWEGANSVLIVWT